MIGQTLQQMTNMLSMLSPEQLSNYVANPDPKGPPQWLALSVLQKQEAARNAMSAPPAPQTTVAQQLVQQAAPPPLQGAALPPLGSMSAPPVSAPYGAPPMPAQAPPTAIDQGLASLPTPEPQYKGGGVVSFAEGDYIDVGPDASPNAQELARKMMLDPELTPEEIRQVFGQQVTPIRAPRGISPTSHLYARRTEDASETPSGRSPFEGFSFANMRGGPETAELPPFPEFNESDYIQPELPKNAAGYKAEDEEFARAYGVNPEFYKDLRSEASKEQEILDRDYERQRSLDEAAGWFRMAQTPGSILQGLAAAGEETTERLGRTNKEYRQDMKEARRFLQQINLSEQEFNQNRADKAATRRDTAQTKWENFTNTMAEKRAANKVAEWEAKYKKSISDTEARNLYNIERMKIEATLQNAVTKSRADLKGDILSRLPDSGDMSTIIKEILPNISDDIVDQNLKTKGVDPNSVSPQEKQAYKVQLATDLTIQYLQQVTPVMLNQGLGALRSAQPNGGFNAIRTGP